MTNRTKGIIFLTMGSLGVAGNVTVLMLFSWSLTGVVISSVFGIVAGLFASLSGVAHLMLPEGEKRV